MKQRVSPVIASQWRTEINRRQYSECKKHIIADISKRTGYAHSTVYYWVASPEFRLNKRRYGKKYQAEHPKESRENSLKYERQHKKERIQYHRTRRSDPEIREHNRLQAQFRRKVRTNIDEFLPQILPAQVPSASIEEMVDALHILTGHSIRPSTLEESINNYLTHHPAPIIQRVDSKYVRT